MDLQWWIAVICVPLVGAIFGIDMVIHRAATASIHNLHARIDMLTGMLSDYKERAAREFVTGGEMLQLEQRLEGYLQRMETKIDRLAESTMRRAQGGH